jgi:UPF0716 protein FxsA
VFKALILAFVVLPFVDLYLLLLLGRQVGFWPTVGLVLAAGLIGSFLARKEGVRVLRRWQESMARGQVPQEGLLGGALVLVGGVLLVIPGVLTDVVGLFLLFPPTRRLVAGLVRRRLERGMAEGTVRVTTFQSSGPFPGDPFAPPEVDEPFARPPSRPSLNRGPGEEVDAEFTEEDGR